MPAQECVGMETFVVRVHESGRTEPGLRGIVDEIASGCRSTFHNAEELVMILTGTTDHPMTPPESTAASTGCTAARR
jgi:hypothetical protein